jgi:hypothetical protein
VNPPPPSTKAVLSPRPRRLLPLELLLRLPSEPSNWTTFPMGDGSMAAGLAAQPTIRNLVGPGLFHGVHAQAQRGDRSSAARGGTSRARRRSGTPARAGQGLQDADRARSRGGAHIRLARQARRRPRQALPQGGQEQRLRLRSEQPPGSLLAEGRPHADPRLELEALHDLHGPFPLRPRRPAAHHRVLQRSDQRRDQLGPLPARRWRSDPEHGWTQQARRPRSGGRRDHGPGAAPSTRG